MGRLSLPIVLSRRSEHILNKNPISSCWVIYQNMGNGADEFAVLDNRAAGHECVNIGTTLFLIFSNFLIRHIDQTQFE